MKTLIILATVAALSAVFIPLAEAKGKIPKAGKAHVTKNFPSKPPKFPK